MNLEDWKQEALENMQKYSTKNSEYFNFWLGFMSGLDIAKYTLKEPD